ncbi:hypothetical protein Droror1_Dr00015793 [Drosera rotundifolia]
MRSPALSIQRISSPFPKPNSRSVDSTPRTLDFEESSLTLERYKIIDVNVGFPTNPRKDSALVVYVVEQMQSNLLCAVQISIAFPLDVDAKSQSAGSSSARLFSGVCRISRVSGVSETHDSSTTTQPKKLREALARLGEAAFWERETERGVLGERDRARCFGRKRGDNGVCLIWRGENLGKAGKWLQFGW